MDQFYLRVNLTQSLMQIVKAIGIREIDPGDKLGEDAGCGPQDLRFDPLQGQGFAADN